MCFIVLSVCRAKVLVYLNRLIIPRYIVVMFAVWGFARLSRDFSFQKKKLLDVGCATGILLSVAQKFGMNVMGVDISKSAVRYVRKLGFPVVNGTVSSVVKRVKLDRFDVITACQIIEHEYDPIEMCRTVRTMLTNSGIFVLSTPNFDTVWRKLMGKSWIGFTHPEHLFFFTPATIVRLLKKSGFRQVTVEPDLKRRYTLGYAISRLGDYVPSCSSITKPLSEYVSRVKIPMPVNPWGDMLVIARP
jgi:2-polyprenyl-3-methyl-5-hydroxy-6-metoxy-1,4-benzoquinol methylase